MNNQTTNSETILTLGNSSIDIPLKECNRMKTAVKMTINDLHQKLYEGIKVTIGKGDISEVKGSDLRFVIAQLLHLSGIVKENENDLYNGETLRSNTGWWSPKLSRLSRELADIVGYDLVSKKGKIGKRIGKAIKAETGQKVDSKHMGLVQTLTPRLARGTYHIERYEDMDWNEGDYGDDGSCFWTDYNDGRLDIGDDENWGTLRLSFEDENRVKRFYYARCVYVLGNRGDIVIFNTYSRSSMQTSDIAKMLQMVTPDLSYKKVSLYVDRDALYINSGTPHSLFFGDIAPYTAVTYTPESNNCNSRNYCFRCDDRMDSDEGEQVRGFDGYWCGYCVRNYATWCDSCEEYVDDDEINTVIDEGQMCDHCVSSGHYIQCCNCNDYGESGDTLRWCVDGEEICSNCASWETDCNGCEMVIFQADEHTTCEGDTLCDSCTDDSDFCSGCNHPTNSDLGTDTGDVICQNCSDKHPTCLSCDSVMSSNSHECLNCGQMAIVMG